MTLMSYSGSSADLPPSPRIVAIPPMQALSHIPMPRSRPFELIWQDKIAGPLAHCVVTPVSPEGLPGSYNVYRIEHCSDKD